MHADHPLRWPTFARRSTNAAPSTKPLNPALDNECINTLGFLSVDAVQKADSGHPGLPMGAAALAYALWTRFLKHNPANPGWFDRDRFVLSPGHGSMLLYSLLHLTGYDLPLEQIKHFREWGSMTPGHPERGVAPGVETTTGPLGQGFGNGVGVFEAFFDTLASMSSTAHLIQMFDSTIVRAHVSAAGAKGGKTGKRSDVRAAASPRKSTQNRTPPATSSPSI